MRPPRERLAQHHAISASKFSVVIRDLCAEAFQISPQRARRAQRKTLREDEGD
jgi:hypothetical protein